MVGPYPRCSSLDAVHLPRSFTTGPVRGVCGRREADRWHVGRDDEDLGATCPTDSARNQRDLRRDSQYSRRASTLSHSSKFSGGATDHPRSRSTCATSAG